VLKSLGSTGLGYTEGVSFKRLLRCRISHAACALIHETKLYALTADNSDFMSPLIYAYKTFILLILISRGEDNSAVGKCDVFDLSDVFIKLAAMCPDYTV
jgi:hypothetical protein